MIVLSLPLILLLSSAYLAALFFVAYISQKKPSLQALSQHPVSYALSLGAYAGIWVIFGTTLLANQQGFQFLAYYFGGSLVFIFSPLLLKPIVSICQDQRLSSLADLFSYRYNSQWAGTLLAIGLVIIALPFLSWQIDILTQAALFLSQSSYSTAYSAALVSCFAAAAFALYFGNNKQHKDRHDELVLIAAISSLFKLVVMLLLGGLAVFAVFSSPTQLQDWLSQQPTTLAVLSDSLSNTESRTLLLIFAAAVLIMPHSFHLAVTENRRIEHIDTASWLFPIYLLLLSLPVLPILWAVKSSGVAGPVTLYPALIGHALNSPIITLLAWLAALSATFVSMVAVLISVSAICTNHLFLPFITTSKKTNSLNLHGKVKIAFTLLLPTLALLSSRFLSQHSNFDYLYYAAYIAILQFLPGIIVTLYWPRGTKKGLLAGLISSYGLWLVLIFVPLLLSDNLSPLHFWQQHFNIGIEYWMITALICLGVNIALFAIVSLLSTHSEEERNAAQTCSQDKLSTPSRYHLAVNNIAEFQRNLSVAIGEQAAAREIQQASRLLNIQYNETRPFALRLLRRQIEMSLSGLLGSTVARQIVNKHLPYAKGSPTAGKHDVQFLELRLEQQPLKLSGLAHEIDTLRRYHRNTLEQLPIGICTINSLGEILMWNKAIEKLTHIQAEAVIGLSYSKLPAPWGQLIENFILEQSGSLYQQRIEIDQHVRWFNLHKAHASYSYKPLNNQTLLLEETTERVLLEQELLHSERLASIGRLAAGIAHEIGNPVTGIACLAQNLKLDSHDDETLETASDIIEQTQRITKIVQSLVNFSHSGQHYQTLNISTVNLQYCANEAINLLSLDKSLNTQNIINCIPAEALIEGDAQLLQQVFINLLNNALDAIDPITGTIHIHCYDKTTSFELHIEDNGYGIADHLQNNIFEPFFTTKDIGRGTGLGLALVYGIIEEHQGSIQVLSPITENNPGTRFIIHLKKSL